jgi:hypothetical protein
MVGLDRGTLLPDLSAVNSDNIARQLMEAFQLQLAQIIKSRDSISSQRIRPYFYIHCPKSDG